MCITSRNASLTNTKILSFKKENGNIFLSYSNEVVSLVNGKNCMILPVPGQLKEEWFYNTKNYSDFITYIGLRSMVSEFLEFGVRTRGIALSKSLKHTKVGMYDIHFSNLITELETLNDELSLGISDELLNFFFRHYRKFSFICCLFDAKEKMDSQPIAFEYMPLNSNIIFFPTMDSHDGTIPKKKPVIVDHMIITTMETDNEPLVLPQRDVPLFLNKRHWGTYALSGDYSNGDIYLDLEQNMAHPNLKRQYETAI